MKRREFFAVLGGAALTSLPLAAHPQPRRQRPLIGWLGGSIPAVATRNLNAYLQGLKDHGREDGKTIDIAYRWADGDVTRLPALAKELVVARPRRDRIGHQRRAASLSCKTTATIPIVGR